MKISGSEINEKTLIPPGKYLGQLTKVEESRNNNSSQVLSFKVTHGAFEGKVIQDWVNFPTGDDETRDEKIMKRLGYMAMELKVWDGNMGKVNIDFRRAIGTAVILDVTERDYKKEDGTPGKVNNLTWAGVIRLDSDRVTPKMRAELGLDGYKVPPPTTVRKQQTEAQKTQAKPDDDLDI